MALAGMALAAMTLAGCSTSSPSGRVEGASTDTFNSLPEATPSGPAQPGTTTAGPTLRAAGKRVLFVRGGVGTTGVDGTGVNSADLSDIFSTNNKGFSNLSTMLAADGFAVTQVEETTGKSPVDLDSLGLSSFSVVVFGSNNAAYDASAAAVLDGYVRNGGAVLFFNDKNYGSTPTDAASSDQDLLRPFGISVGLDAGLGDGSGVALDPGVATPSDHPILRGVSKVTGLGVTHFRVDSPPAGVTVTELVPMPPTADVVDFDSPNTSRKARDGDLGVVVAEAGKGRVVATFDRDTFFNDAIQTEYHTRYTRNLFRWLAGISVD